MYPSEQVALYPSATSCWDLTNKVDHKRIVAFNLLTYDMRLLDELLRPLFVVIPCARRDEGSGLEVGVSKASSISPTSRKATRP